VNVLGSLLGFMHQVSTAGVALLSVWENRSMLTPSYTRRRAVDGLRRCLRPRSVPVGSVRAVLLPPPQDAALNGDYDKLTDEEREFVGVEVRALGQTG